jgi:hypothetical protein
MLGRHAVKYVGTAGVAAWLGVKPQTVTKWLMRYHDMPEPDAYLGPGRSFRMWLPEREAEWRAWACSRPGRGAPGRPRKRQPGRHYGDPDSRRVRPVADRLLLIVGLLQGEPGVTGGEIAKRLKITLRTLRRDTQLLRDLGYPVIARPGKGGGYSFDPDETVPWLDCNSIAAALSQLNAARRSPAGLPENSKPDGTLRTSPMPRDQHAVSPRGTSRTTDTDGGDHGIPGPRTA